MTGRLCVAAAVGLGLTVACAPRVAPVVAPPPPPTPLALPVSSFDGPAGAEVTVAADRVAEIIDGVEREFQAGREAWGEGRAGAAREHFDQAVERLIQLPEGARSDPRLSAALDSLLERIAAIELGGARSAAALTEAKAEPAAIDELLSETAVDRLVPAATTAETVARDLERLPPGIPVPLHPKVLSYVELFQGRLREFMQAGLDRAQPYLPMITRVFREQDVPLDLVYVPLVESAFKTNALSRASARGMWQFMLGTAREHDMQQTWFVDERSDPEKSTLAAAQYLKSLQAVFDGDWHFALASYNAGPGRLQSAVRRSKKTDFWAIAGSTRYLPRETREYVPMVLAAIIIARNPELYGFTVEPAAPRVWETVTIPDALALTTIAEWAEVPVEAVSDLNPELRRGITPTSSYALKVPVGTAASIQAQLESHTEFLKFRFHQVKAGETLATIARKYGFTTKQLRDANDLRSSRVTRNQPIMIPAAAPRAVPTAARPTSAKPSSTSPVTAGSAPQVYRVRPGDTLSSIARQFDTTIDVLKRINQLSTDRIKAGDRLTIPR